MGVYFADQYSLLHFATGVIAYFFDIDLPTWFILHGIFELVENTETGIRFINTNLKFWPGGKPRSDSTTNSVGDQFFSMMGWMVACTVDYYGSKHGYYSPHLRT